MRGCLRQEVQPTQDPRLSEWPPRLVANRLIAAPTSLTGKVNGIVPGPAFQLEFARPLPHIVLGTLSGGCAGWWKCRRATRVQVLAQAAAQLHTERVECARRAVRKRSAIDSPGRCVKDHITGTIGDWQKVCYAGVIKTLTASCALSAWDFSTHVSPVLKSQAGGGIVGDLSRSVGTDHSVEADHPPQLSAA